MQTSNDGKAKRIITGSITFFWSVHFKQSGCVRSLFTHLDFYSFLLRASRDISTSNFLFNFFIPNRDFLDFIAV